MSSYVVTRRRVLALSGGFLAGAVLASCGGVAAPTPAPAKPTEAPQPAAQPPTAAAAAATQAGAAAKPTEQPKAAAGAGEGKPTAAPQAAGAPSAQKTTLVVWASSLTQDDQSTPGGKYARWVRGTFEEQYPKYAIKAEDHGWGLPLRMNLLTAVAGGTVPDVTHGEWQVREFASRGAYFAIPDLSPKLFAPGPIAGCLYKGQVYGVPANTSIFALVTNTRVAAKAGVDPNKPPKTWQELLTNAELASKKGAGEFVGYVVWGPIPARPVAAMLRTLPYINQTGKSLADADATQAFFNAAEQVAAYDLLRQLLKFSDKAVAFSNEEGKLESYLLQDKALYTAAAMSTVFNARDAKAEVVVHPLPRKDASVSGNVVVGNETFSVLTKGKERDGAVDLVKFLAKPDAQRQIGNLLGQQLPSTVEVLSDRALEKLPAYAVEATAVRVYADILVNESATGLPAFPKNPDKIWAAWNDALGKILLGDDPIKPILDGVQTKVVELLA
jgi:multiple sugar transport system substrate-binding protein